MLCFVDGKSLVLVDFSCFCGFFQGYMFQIIKESLSQTDHDPFTEGKGLFQTYIAH